MLVWFGCLYFICFIFFLGKNAVYQRWSGKCLGEPSQLAKLSRSEFDPELFSHSVYVKFFCDIRDKRAVFKILRQNETIFWYRKWIGREEIDREWGNLESESLSPFPHSLSISSFSLHFLFIFTFSLDFLAARMPGCQDPTICATLWWTNMNLEVLRQEE